MSTDCENLLKKFLVLNPLKRASLEVHTLYCAQSVKGRPKPVCLYTQYMRLMQASNMNISKYMYMYTFVHCMYVCCRV